MVSTGHKKPLSSFPAEAELPRGAVLQEVYATGRGSSIAHGDWTACGQSCYRSDAGVYKQAELDT